MFSQIEAQVHDIDDQLDQILKETTLWIDAENDRTLRLEK